MCKIVKDLQVVAVSADGSGSEKIVELSAKGYQMFFAPKLKADTVTLLYTLTLIQETDVKEYEAIVKESIKAL